MSKGNKITVLILSGIAIILGVVSLFIAYRNKTMTALEYVISKGAKKTTNVNAGDRYDFGDFGFYSNNRAAQFSSGKKGTYNKQFILFDDGSKILLIDIFK